MHTQHTKAVRQVLRNHGYDIPEGSSVKHTESALQDFHSSNGSPEKWNTRSKKNTPDVLKADGINQLPHTAAPAKGTGMTATGATGNARQVGDAASADAWGAPAAPRRLEPAASPLSTIETPIVKTITGAVKSATGYGGEPSGWAGDGKTGGGLLHTIGKVAKIAGESVLAGPLAPLAAGLLTANSTGGGKKPTPTATTKTTQPSVTPKTTTTNRTVSYSSGSGTSTTPSSSGSTSSTTVPSTSVADKKAADTRAAADAQAASMKIVTDAIAAAKAQNLPLLGPADHYAGAPVMKTPTPISLKDFVTDPAKLAQAQANQTYNPQISQANRSIADATRQGAINIADLQKWYGNAGSIAAAGAQQSHTMGQQDQANQGTVAQGILSAFGGSAGQGGDSLANTALIDSKQLAGQGQASDAFNSMLQGLISTQGAADTNSQRNRDQTSIGSMKDALTALIAQKASALTTNTAANTQQNLTNTLGIKAQNNTDAYNTANFNAGNAYQRFTANNTADTNRTNENVAITGANNAMNSAGLNTGITMATLPSALDAASLANDATTANIDYKTASAAAVLQQAYAKGQLSKVQYDKTLSEISLNKYKLAHPAGAKATDILGTRTYLGQGLAALLKGSTDPNKVAQIIRQLSPGITGSQTPRSFYQSVIVPTLVAGGYTGTTPAMFGLTG